MTEEQHNRLYELSVGRLLLEHAYARLGMYATDRDDREAQRILEAAVYRVDDEAYRIRKGLVTRDVR